MATPNKALNTPARGSNVNTWDTPINSNFTILDTCLGGTLNVSITSANVTLSSSDSLNLRYSCSGALTGNRILIFPASVGGFWIISNGCSGAFTLSARSGAGASIVIPQGGTSFVTSDGTTMQFADSNAATGQSSYAVDTGAADVYVITPPQAVALKVGTTVFWSPTNTNTSACTLAASGTAATAIKTIAGADPIAGALAVNGVYISTYDGTVWRTAGLGAANFSLYSADAGAGAGPILELYRDSASPAALDATGTTRFTFKDSGANKTTGATIGGQIISPTDGAEYFSVTHYALTNGALQKEMEVGDGIEIGSPTGGNLGFGTVNATGLYINSIPLGALSTQAASASASLDISSLVAGIYDVYFNNILVTTNAASLVIRFSVAASFISTASYYYQINAGNGATTAFVGTDTLANGTGILMTAAQSNAALSNLSGSATLIVGGATAGGTSINGSFTTIISAGNHALFAFGGRNSTASQIDGIQLISPSGSTIASGSMSIFRRA